MDEKGKIIIYTDGSALKNGSADSGCGWAAKLVYDGKHKVKSGGCRGRTNNQMEMLAVLNALKCITDKNIPVVIYSDSKYVVETLKGRYRVGKNAELWAELLPLFKSFPDITINWVRGHNGDQNNEEVDRLAVAESKKWQR